jgi:probable addiction module antidote protein
MNKKTSSYRDSLLEALSDPTEAAHYLNAAKDESPEMFLKALRNVAQAKQVAVVARKAGVTRENLYRAFSAEGNPTLDTLDSVLGALGLKLTIEAQSSEAPSVPLVRKRSFRKSHRNESR